MKAEQDYIRDIAEIRTMMERSSRFLSLSGWAGIMAGIYALSGAYIAYGFFGFNPDDIYYSPLQAGSIGSSLWKVILLALFILILAVGTAMFLSYKKALKRGEKVWNSTAKRLLINMAIPLISGGLLMVILIAHRLIGLVAPFSLIFYGLALYNASKFTLEDVKTLGLIQIVLGLMGAFFVGWGLFLWALGFGVFHIIYGIFMHYRYDR